MSNKPKSVTSVFLAVIKQLAPEERADYLDEICGKDAALRQKVKLLLHSYGDQGNSLNDQAIEEVATADEDFERLALRESVKLFERGTDSEVSETNPVSGTVSLNDRSATGRSRTSSGSWLPDYELLNEIARGGMGIVYKARQISLNRIVALKVIRAGELADAVQVERFRKEAEAAANLDHPGIVPVYEVGKHDGQYYLSMAYVEGQSLADRLRDGPLPPKEAAELTKTIAEAVAHAHHHGIIHRDIKPGNVLITPEGVPRIMDFGLAKRIEGDSELTATGQILGTPSYMPPEQAAGMLDAIGTTADVYALGALLYALLTGRPPFQAANVMDTLMQVLEREPVCPRQLNGSVPKDLETVCLKCLAKASTRRYSTATELAEELNRFLQGKPIVARHVSAIERVQRWVVRNPLACGVIITTAAALLAIVGLGVSYSYQSRLQEALSDTEDARKAEALANDELDRFLYHRRIRLTVSELNSQQIHRARELLAECPAHLRHWEWYYLHRVCNPEQQILRGHSSTRRAPPYNPFFTCAAFSPNHKQVLAVHNEWFTHEGRPVGGTISVWDLDTGKQVLILRGHSWMVNFAAIDPDGRRIASAGTDGIRVWNAETGEELLAFAPGESEVEWLTYSHDGRRIVSATHNDITTWNAETGESHSTIKTDADVWAITGGNTGVEIACASRNEEFLRIWSADTGQLLHDHKIKTSGGIGCLAYSPDGRQLACGARDGRLVILDPRSGEHVSTSRAGHDGIVRWIAYRPDGEAIATVGLDGPVKIWNATDLDVVVTYDGHVDGAKSATYSPDGELVVSAGNDDTVRVWAPERASRFRVLPRECEMTASVVFSPTGSSLAGAVNREVKVLVDKATGITKREWTGRVVLYDLASGKTTLTSQHKGRINQVAFSPNGDRIVGAGENGIVTVWDSSNAKEIRTINEGNRITSVSFSHDGSQIASTQNARKFMVDSNGFEAMYWVGTLAVWNAKTGLELLRQDGEKSFQGMNAVRFSPVDKLIATAESFFVTLTAVKDGARVAALDGHQAQVTAIAFRPDGAQLVSASADQTLKLWDIKSGREVVTLRGHTETIDDVAFSPDGKRIVSVDRGGNMKLWDAAHGEEVLTESGYPSPVMSVGFSPDGKHIVTGSKNGLVLLWEGGASAR